MNSITVSNMWRLKCFIMISAGFVQALKRDQVGTASSLLKVYHRCYIDGIYTIAFDVGEYCQLYIFKKLKACVSTTEARISQNLSKKQLYCDVKYKKFAAPLCTQVIVQD